MKPKCTKAVILAAGCGSRVRSITPEKPKCLMDLGGRPIVVWILDALARAGIKEVLIVTGFRGAHLRRALGTGGWYGCPEAARTPRDKTRAQAARPLSISYVHNPRWRLPNGLSLYAARRAIRRGETFLLLMSDHLINSEMVEQVARAKTPRCVLAVDTHVARVFDLGDATKVRVVGGKPVAINKRLRKYNAVDCGLFRFDRRVFRALEASFMQGTQSLTGGVKQLVARGEIDVVPIGAGSRWLDVDTPRAYKHAATLLGAFTRGCKQRRRT